VAIDFRATPDLRQNIHGNSKESKEQNSCIIRGGGGREIERFNILA
jgi:hypothetical protein